MPLEQNVQYVQNYNTESTIEGVNNMSRIGRLVRFWALKLRLDGLARSLQKPGSRRKQEDSNAPADAALTKTPTT